MLNLNKPSTDFNRVRDGRNSPDAYFDLDLTNTFDTFINVAGNSFYIDANPADGNAVVYFQETDKLRGPTPFYVSPGFIARIPFTQIRVVNLAAQPGKKIRIVYGVDTDFQPGSVSQVSFAGEVNVIDTMTTANQHWYQQNNATAVGYLATTILAPGANPNGVYVNAATIGCFAGAGNSFVGGLFAAAAAPASFATGVNRIQLLGARASSSNSALSWIASLNRKIPAAWGLYFCELTSGGACNYDANLEYRLA